MSCTSNDAFDVPPISYFRPLSWQGRFQPGVRGHQVHVRVQHIGYVSPNGGVQNRAEYPYSGSTDPTQALLLHHANRYNCIEK